MGKNRQISHSEGFWTVSVDTFPSRRWSRIPPFRGYCTVTSREDCTERGKGVTFQQRKRQTRSGDEGRIRGGESWQQALLTWWGQRCASFRNPSPHLTMRKPPENSQWRDSRRNPRPVLLEILKVVKNKDSLKTVTSKRSQRRRDTYMSCGAEWDPGGEKEH